MKGANRSKRASWGVVEVGSDINPAKNQAIGGAGGNRDQLCARGLLHLANVVHQTAVIAHGFERQVRVLRGLKIPGTLVGVGETPARMEYPE
jgi:hypothetical protein